jgi:hypothetical protein
MVMPLMVVTMKATYEVPLILSRVSSKSVNAAERNSTRNIARKTRDSLSADPNLEKGQSV